MRLVSAFKNHFASSSPSGGRRGSRVLAGLVAAGAIAGLATGDVSSQGERRDGRAPITIQEQGSFAVGGKVLGDPDKPILVMRSFR